MSRPQNKNDLLSLSKINFDKLMNFIESFSLNEQMVEFPEGTRDRNTRDVLVHLHEWHLMMIRWYEEGMDGVKPNMPAKGYTWKTTADMNKEIWKKYQGTSLNKSKELINESFLNVRSIIEKHSDKDLFTKKKYNWTGTTSLGSYLVSATSSHYDWAVKLIKKAKK